MQLQRTLRKTVILAVHMVVARCAMYGEYDCYNGNMYNNACGYNPQPMQTLDDAYYYGDLEFDAVGCNLGGCSTGGCSVQMDPTPAIGGGAFPEQPIYSQPSFPMQPSFPAQPSFPVQQSFPEQVYGQGSFQGQESYEMSSGYFTESSASGAAQAHTATCANNPANISSQQGATSGMTEQITVLLNGNVPVEMHPTTITVGENTYPLSSTPAISAPASLTVGHAQIHDLNLSEAIIIDLPTPTREEIAAAAAGNSAAGLTAAQLKKEQEMKDGDCKDKKKGKKGKSGKKGAAKAGAVQKKKNGVAGVSTLVAIAVLPIIALLM
ncbi:hypothetical protein NEMIN01_0844 [Nematocida minor]|uniref:uncharacterized protein n=1 Tax=Nematocida minor TaxID=1912983 RepID=UPI00221FCF19|nr:uncharacterized protein NEMIN01_0844 [Nematocida minor]KAI5190059.1 hypothetical protein NEMIN01_0844 [Nematocida minor]